VDNLKRMMNLMETNMALERRLRAAESQLRAVSP
jgi:hypothetical protein